jgi:hypothetical protein
MRFKTIFFVVRHRLASLLGKMVFPILDSIRILHARVKGLPLPLPELGIQNGGVDFSAGRGVSSYEKWKLIQSALPAGCVTAVDIGANNGFFSMRLANEGVFTIAFEPDIELLQLGVVAACKNQKYPLAFSAMPVTLENAFRLPKVDVTLVLSVAQRWVHLYGQEGMKKIMEQVWEKTGKAMFFELPNPVQSTKEANWLSFLGESEEEMQPAITNLLAQIGASNVILLGYLPTDFRPNEKRHLFVALKE